MKISPVIILAMSVGLVYATHWEHVKDTWRVRLLIDGEPGSLFLDRGTSISFKIGKGRFCIGYSRMTIDYSTANSWKERVSCPTSSPSNSNLQCRSCAMKDASNACTRCTGDTCVAHTNIRDKCKNSEAYVYLAVFGYRVKAGVSQGRRIEERWIEQGADAARRVLAANGREARVYEKRIQNELGALRGVKANAKMSFTDPRELDWGLKSLEKHTAKIRDLFPLVRHVDEKTTLLSDVYGLPLKHGNPIEVKIRDNVAVSGRIIGAKGPILFLDNAGIAYSVNLHSLIGRRIFTDMTSSSPTQSGLKTFFMK